MIQRLMITSFLIISSAQAAPCPTCPKGYVHSSLEDVLLSKKQGKDLGVTKVIRAASTPQSRVQKTPPKTPIQIVASRTEQLKKSYQSKPQVDMFGSPARSKEANLRLSEEHRRKMETFAHQELMQRYAEKRRK